MAKLIVGRYERENWRQHEIVDDEAESPGAKVADLNEDGRPDFVAGKMDAGGWQFALNQGGLISAPGLSNHCRGSVEQPPPPYQLGRIWPLRSTPRSPMNVSYPSGSVMIKSWIWASAAHSSISLRVALFFP